MRKHNNIFTLLSTLLITALPVSALACAGNILDEGGTVFMYLGGELRNGAIGLIIVAFVFFLVSILTSILIIKSLKITLAVIATIFLIISLAFYQGNEELFSIFGIIIIVIAGAKLSLFITKKITKSAAKDVVKIVTTPKFQLILLAICALEAIFIFLGISSMIIIEENGFDVFIDKFF